MSQFFGSFVDVSRTPHLKINAFQEGYAIIRDAQGRPVPPPFPYITFPIIRPDFGSQTIATASIWDRRPSMPGFFGLVDDVLRQVQEKIPHEGIILKLDSGDGLISLHRNPGNFINYMDDPDDQLITRGIVSLVIASFIP